MTLTNAFHNSSVNVHPSATGRISARVMAGAHKRTCGQKDCRCGLTPPQGMILEQATDAGDYDVRAVAHA